MKWIIVTGLLLLPAFGQSTKEQIKEVQRDIAMLHDDMRQMQTQHAEKLAAMQVLIQQSLDASVKASSAVTVLQNGLAERLGEQFKSMGGGVASMSTKVDTLADEFRAVRDAIAELTARMGRLDQKVADVSNAIRTIQTPAAPPPGAGAPGGATPPASLPSAATLYDSAYRDYNGGKLDLAMQEFQEYLKYFDKTELAPNAQFYIGDIYLRTHDTDNAVKAFDAVLEHYSDNNKTTDARYMKAQALFQSGQRNASQKEYCEVILRYPDHPLAAKARSALRGMGLSGACGGAPAVAPKKPKRR